MSDALVSIDDVRAARERVRGVALRTPLVYQKAVSPDRPTAIKPESLQPTGAFKLRGAANAVASIPEDRRAAGVVTHSSGNHGLALAWVARSFGVPAVVVSPKDTPEVKVSGMRDLGAEVVLVTPAERSSTANRLAEERGAELVPPFEDARIIAGQGTVGLEIAEDAPDVAVVLVPVGGGGLISGVSLALAATRPEVKVVGVEPELAGDTRESFAAGRRVVWDDERRNRTVADGVRVNVGELTWRHIERHVHDVVTVTEAEIAAAMVELAGSYRLVAEPAGAVAPAAAFYHSGELPPGRTVAVLSGGNIDPRLLADVLRPGSR